MSWAATRPAWAGAILRPVINNLVYPGLSAEEKIKNLVIGILVMAGIYLVVPCIYLQRKIMIGAPQKPW